VSPGNSTSQASTPVGDPSTSVASGNASVAGGTTTSAGTPAADASTVSAGSTGAGLVGAASVTQVPSIPNVSTKSAPAVTQNPQSIVVQVGRSASFAVQATGSDTLSFQWMRGGNPIVGATASTYAMPVTQLADNGASFSVAVSNSVGSTTSAAARLTVNGAASTGATVNRPFSDQSLWNARPTKFTLGTATIPTSDYYPLIGGGAYSLAASVASNTDPAMVVYPMSGQSGVWVPDAEVSYPTVTIPHWPATVTLPGGTDGHADIIDVANNRIHSFWQLSQTNGRWQAAQYTWTPLDGSGWGTPGAPIQGSRAAGVVSIAGVIRSAEVHDGQDLYKHALAMSLTFNGLAASPAFVFPATASDYDAQYVNTGAIPEGARVMLPANFDASGITNPQLLKVVKTLQSYGAYVVDRNYGTPFYIVVENGSDFNLMPTGWDGAIAAQLDAIRAAMRPIATVTEWVDATGAIFTPDRNQNILSMRGPWTVSSGTDAGQFDVWQQAVIFPSNGQRTVQTNASGRSAPSVVNNPPAAGQHVRIRVLASGGATVRVMLGGATWIDTGPMIDGQEVTLTWPSTQAYLSLEAASGPQGGGQVSATMVPLSN
jgi:hypothetical protein